MSMQRKTITVTEQQEIWIKSQIDSGKYGNDSEYLRDLIRLDQEHKQRIEVLRSALIAGEKSGICKRTMADILEDAKKRNSLKLNKNPAPVSGLISSSVLSYIFNNLRPYDY